MAQPHEVLLESDLGSVGQLEAGAEGVVGHGHQADAQPPRAGQLRGHHSQPGALTEPLGPIAVGGQVLVAEVEPGDPAQPAQRFHDPPALAGQAPARLGVDGVGQGVHHRVQVRSDVESVQDGVVAGVDDGRDVPGRGHLDHPPQEPGRPDPSGQGRDHRAGHRGPTDGGDTPLRAATHRARRGWTIGAGYPAPVPTPTGPTPAPVPTGPAARAPTRHVQGSVRDAGASCHVRPGPAVRRVRGHRARSADRPGWAHSAPAPSPAFPVSRRSASRPSPSAGADDTRWPH